MTSECVRLILIGQRRDIETVQITEKTVNPLGERISPHDFQLLKVLGKGGYGKVDIETQRVTLIELVRCCRCSKCENNRVAIRAKSSP